MLAVILSACLMTSNGAMKSNRVGLSEYTARRLAELRARRAEADDTGGISIGSPLSTSTAAEATVNDSDCSVVPPAVTAPQTTAAPTYNNTTGAVLSAAKPPADSSFSIPKTASQGISAPTAASNGVSEQSSEMADMAAKHKQLLNDVLESRPSAEQHRIDRQDVSNARAPTELSKPPVRHREIPQPSQFSRSGSRSVDASPVEVGAVSKTVSALPFFIWFYNKDYVTSCFVF